MKIKQTLFKTEIEITPQEIRELYESIQPNTGVWDWFCKILRIKPYK